MIAWQVMWILAFSIYASLKWLTVRNLVKTWQVWAYLLAWPGMNPKEFLQDPKIPATVPEFLFACAKTVFGFILTYWLAPLFVAPLISGWIGMTGIVFILHFGIFHLLSLFWRIVGFNAIPIMNFPLIACSLSDFWGRRWNLAFRDLVFGILFRPVAKLLGIITATLVVFIFSGIVHDVVMSIPVGSGFGGPTIYFIIQGCGLLLERKYSLCSGRVFCFVCVLLPIPLLFHPGFVENAILPTMKAIGAI